MSFKMKKYHYRKMNMNKLYGKESNILQKENNPMKFKANHQYKILLKVVNKKNKNLICQKKKI